MGDEQRHFTFGQFVETFEDFEFRASIQRRRRLIENQDLRFPQIRARQSELLPLTAR